MRCWHEDLATPCRRRLAPGNVDNIRSAFSLRTGRGGFCEFDDQFVWSDLDSNEVVVDESPIVDLARDIEMISNRFYDECFNLFGWNSCDGSGLLSLAMEQDR